MECKKIPVILDTDIGRDIDDTWALSFLLKCPELDVKLITTATDDTTIKARYVAKFLDEVNRTDIPIGIGSPENDLKRNLYKWFKDYELSNYPGTIYEDGIKALCSTIMDSQEPITLIAIGPLGNIASALKMNPRITENARFVGMQGSIRIGYFEKPNPHPEFNVVMNIQACREVLSASWEKTITPLDTCGSVVLSGNHYKRILNSNNKIASLLIENYEIWAKGTGLSKRTIENQQTSVLFDTVAIYLGFSEDFVNIEQLKIKVSEKGFTQISEKGNMIRCATSWKNINAFRDLLVDRLVA